MIANKFFIVGCPRSGTTMLQQALNRHSQIAIPPETAFFSMLGYSKWTQHEHLQRIKEDLEIDLPTPPARLRCTLEARTFYEQIIRLYVERMDKPSITHFGEKTNEHLSRLHRIRRLFPDAKVILLVRDGRDVALSLRRLPWTSRNLYVNFALWLHCYRLQKSAQRHGGLPLICVRYEDLTKDPEKELRAILTFLGLPYEPQMVEGEGNAVGIPAWEHLWKARAAEKIKPHRMGLWRQELPAEQLGILERWGSWALQELGYELITDGRTSLPWCFHLRVAWRSLFWLVRRPRYAQAKAFWVQQHGLPSMTQTLPHRKSRETLNYTPIGDGSATMVAAPVTPEKSMLDRERRS